MSDSPITPNDRPPQGHSTTNDRPPQLTDEQKLFLNKALSYAQHSLHIFPIMAACEAALESGWGKSALASEDNNLFGKKQQKHPIYGTVSIPTNEFIEHKWVRVDAKWVKYPSWTECFQDRMDTLCRLKDDYPHYAAALAATDPEVYIREVSKTWSTDPKRADKVLEIYDMFIRDLIVT